MKLDKTFSNLRQVILLEEFKDCDSQDSKIHFEDKNVTILEEAQSYRILSLFFIERIFSQDLKITIIFKSSDSCIKAEAPRFK